MPDVSPHVQPLSEKQTQRGEHCNAAPPRSEAVTSLIRNDRAPPTHLSVLFEGYPGSQIQRLAASVVSSGHRFDRRCSAAARVSASTLTARRAHSEQRWQVNSLSGLYLSSEASS